MGWRIDIGVPYGNACAVSVAEAGDVSEVGFSPDPHGGPECLWFCFRLRRTGRRAAGRVRLVLRNFGNVLGGRDPAAVRPVARRAGEGWKRLPPGRREELPDGRMNAVWTLEPGAAAVDLALCYPYGVPEVERLVEATGGHWRRDVIGVSQGGRELVRLSNACGGRREGRRGLFVVARQHSAETPGSWVLDGFLRRLAQSGDRAPLTWAVPLSNIDGVEQGDYGKDNFPYDLNRAWGAPPMRHEALVIQRDMQRWRKRCRPALCLDFHAPGAAETGGVYTYLPRPREFPALHRRCARWARLLGAALTERYAAEDFARVVDYASRWETPTFTVFCSKAFAIPALTLETPYALCRGTLMTPARYRQAGALLADAVTSKLGA